MTCEAKGKWGPFSNVMHVPKIAYCLLGLRPLEKLGYKVDFINREITKDGQPAWKINYDESLKLFTVSVSRTPPKPHGPKALSSISYMSKNLAEVLHRRFNHSPKRLLMRICKLHKIEVPQKHFAAMRLCNGCALAKAVNLRVPSKMARRPMVLKPQAPPKFTKPFEHISIDTAGPITPASPRMSRWMHIFACTVTGYYYACCTRSRSQIAEEFVIWHKQVPINMGFVVKTVRNDNAPELVSGELKRYLEDCGIRTEPTPPYSSFANGRAERAIRTVTTGTRALMADSGVAANLWPYAVMCFVFVRNRLPSMTRLSPMELITGRRPNIHYFRIFGCRTHVHIHEEERSKSNRFKPISAPAVFLGYVPGSKSFYVGMRGAVFSRRSVYFDEDVDAIIKRHAQSFNAEVHHDVEPNRPRHPHEPGTEALDPLAPPAPSSVTPVEGGNTGQQTDAPNQNPVSPPVNPVIAEDPPTTTDETAEARNEPPPTESFGRPQPANLRRSTRKTRSSSRNISMQGYISERSALRRALNESKLTENASLAQTATAVPHQQNFNWRLAQRELALTLMIAAEIPTPKTYSQAMSSNYADKWEGAVKRELGSLHEKSVWKVVPLPKGAKLVGMSSLGLSQHCFCLSHECRHVCICI